MRINQVNGLFRINCNKHDAKNKNSKIVLKKVQRKVSIIVPIAYPLNSLYKLLVKTVFWKYLQIYFMHMSILYLLSLMMMLIEVIPTW